MTATIGNRRLGSQWITAPAIASPQDIVAWHGAMQGQDYAGTKWSVGLRMVAGTDADVERALQERAIVRTWALRGTLHFVAAADVRWMLSLVASRQIAASARRYRELELDAQTLTRSSTLLAEALRDGVELDRVELFAILERHGISTQGQRGVYMLARASLECLICQGVARRNVPSFVALDERVPAGAPLTRAEALAELARRYFTSHGPATVKDFVWWCGLAPADARAGLADAASFLRRETVGETTYWYAEETEHEDTRTQGHEVSFMHSCLRGEAAGVFALPGFDEYLLGYANRHDVLDPQYADRIVPGGNGMFLPTIVSDGQVVGTWKRALAKRRVVITTDPFRPLSDAEHADFAAAITHYGAFVELPTSIVGGV